MPSWLGIDRALAGWGAFQEAKFSGMESDGLLVADAGTVLSITRITANGEFAGGQLIAGLHLQRSAMANGAKNLDDPGPPSTNTDQFPITTAEAMLRGSFQALVGTLMEAKKLAKMPIWLCGGDAEILFEYLKGRISDLYVCPDLILEAMVKIDLNSK